MIILLLGCFDNVTGEKDNNIYLENDFGKGTNIHSKPQIQSQMKHHLLRTTDVNMIFFWCSSEVILMLFTFAMTDQACFSILYNVSLLFRWKGIPNQDCPSPGTAAVEAVVKECRPRITWRWRWVRSAAQMSRPSWWRCISTWKRGKLPLRGYRTWASNRVSAASSLPPPLQSTTEVNNLNKYVSLPRNEWHLKKSSMFLKYLFHKKC